MAPSIWGIILILFHILPACIGAPLHAMSVVPDGWVTSSTREVSRNPMSRFGVEATVQAPIEGLEISANITTLERAGDTVEVWFCCVAKPKANDFVVLYAPANVDPSATAPVKMKVASEDGHYLAMGGGTVRFQVFNHRADMRFAFVRGGREKPVIAAWSPVVNVKNPNEPLQGHLHLTGDNTEMLVQWVTKNSSNPAVKWGSAPGIYHSSAIAETTTYARHEMCGGAATGVGWIDPGVFHFAVMHGLEPGKKYFYTYGDEDYGFSEERSFQAAPPVGPQTAVSFLAIADLGQAEEDRSVEPFQYSASLETTRWLAQEADSGVYQLLIHNGDISYARGYVPQWDHYFEQIKSIVTRMPYMTTPGNHERDWPNSGDRFHTCTDSGGECGIAYHRRCHMPVTSKDVAWYSFDFGPVHFLEYSTEHDFNIGSIQYRFIEEDLKSVNRSKTPWLIVGGHRPIYIDSVYAHWPDGDLEVAFALKQALEPLFYKYKVDLTWHGHHHSYQRTCPVYREQCLGYREDGTARGPVHMVIGHAGADLCYDIQPRRPPYFEKVIVEHGYSRIFANGTELRMDVLYDRDQTMMDSITLRKPADWQSAWDVDVAKMPSVLEDSSFGLSQLWERFKPAGEIIVQ